MRQEQIIERDKRFITISEYCKRSGLSYATVNHMLKTNQLRSITTEGGLRRIDTLDFNADNKIVLERLDKQEKMLAALCKQFNTVV